MRIEHSSHEEYCRLLPKTVNASPFHEPFWHEVLLNSFTHLSIFYWLIVGSVGEPVALLPVFHKRRCGLNLCGSPLRGMYTAYLGPAWLVAMDSALCSLPSCLPDLCRAHKADFFELSLQPGERTGLPGASSASTVVVDLEASESELWMRLSKNARRQVLRCRDAGIEVRLCKSKEEWASGYFSLVCEVYSRQGLRPPVGEHFFYFLERLCNETPAVSALMAYRGKDLVGGGIYLLGKDTLFGIDGASTRKLGSLSVNAIVEWETIRWAASIGLKKYDMLGASIPGIASFKASFGGRVVEYERFLSLSSLRGRLVWRLYSRVDRVIKRYMRP